MKAVKLALAVSIIFCSGILTGSWMDRFFISRRQSDPAATSGSLGPAWARLEFIRRAQHHLNLTESQKQNIDRILSESQSRLRVLWDPIAPQVQEELRQVRANFLAELNADQRLEFERLSQQRASRRVEDTAAKNRPRKKEDRPDTNSAKPISTKPAAPTP